jgi:SAM-dependent methyltransferase
MIALGRRLYRAVLPRRLDPILDTPVEPTPDDSRFADVYARQVQEGPDRSDFVMARYAEGMRWREVLRRTTKPAIHRVIDIGAGNGAVELAFAADQLFIASVEVGWNEPARLLHKAAGVPFRRVIASADSLPFKGAVFSHAVCLETIEHVSEPRSVGDEIGRVLDPGGYVLLTTPPRVRYLFAPDPHFGIRGLLMLPAFLQRKAAARRGFAGEHHFVDRIYWSIFQVARMFRSCAVERVLSRSRGPRFLLWDAILLRKREAFRFSKT